MKTFTLPLSVLMALATSVCAQTTEDFTGTATYTGFTKTPSSSSEIGFSSSQDFPTITPSSSSSLISSSAYGSSSSSSFGGYYNSSSSDVEYSSFLEETSLTSLTSEGSIIPTSASAPILSSSSDPSTTSGFVESSILPSSDTSSPTTAGATSTGVTTSTTPTYLSTSTRPSTTTTSSSSSTRVSTTSSSTRAPTTSSSSTSTRASSTSSTRASTTSSSTRASTTSSSTRTSSSSTRTSSSSTSTSAAATSSGLTPVEQAILDRHNEYRARHGVPNLTWNSELSAYAQSYIDELSTTSTSACSGTLVHSPRTGLNYGENLAYGNISPTQGVDLWYNENVYYNYDDPENSSGDFESYGHFTQLVWKDTTQLGCVVQSCPSNRIYLICEYYTAGNIFLGGNNVDRWYFFKRNVLAPVS
ncbi:CYFA0S35e00716g1_1 [Cyberlindnera fabianii]|uniref:CYFA0S35e00716g1_1 n=1 Tax=Cyberlindnera fabianii TaxID=36022 RepID=A0A061BKT8_CYBFA|nr:CYFA0S35e00716g1_1 [Cyberlindnera fabianii]